MQHINHHILYYADQSDNKLRAFFFKLNEELKKKDEEEEKVDEMEVEEVLSGQSDNIWSHPRNNQN